MSILKNLTNEELLEYKSLIHNLTKREQDERVYSYDVKFAYHLVRLLNECEQILTTGDLDIELNNEQHKSIRRGEWSLEQILEYFETKEKYLEELYIKSDVIPYKPDEVFLKNLLLQCLESHYGSLDNIIQKPTDVKNIINELEQVINKYR